MSLQKSKNKVTKCLVGNIQTDGRDFSMTLRFVDFIIDVLISIHRLIRGSKTIPKVSDRKGARSLHLNKDL